LATTFLLGAFYFLKKNTPLFILFLVFAGLTKEQVWLIDALLALYFVYYYLKRKNKYRIILGTVITLMSVGAFYYLVWYAIPSLNPSNKHFALSFYSDFGGSPTSIVKNILFSPFKTLSILFGKDQLFFLKELFMPVGFLSLLSPLYLIFTIPDFLIDLLSNNSQLHQIYYQYTACLTPFIFISAIYGVKNIFKWFSKIPKSLIITFVLIMSLISAYLFGPLPGSMQQSIDVFIKPQPNRDFINHFLSIIPKSYSVAATNNVGAHLSHRQKIYTIPVGVEKADLVIFLLDDKFAQPSLGAQEKIVKELQQNKSYKEIVKIGDFIAFRKANLPSWGMNFRRRQFF
jgi:uncharacterized membrane protein